MHLVMFDVDGTLVDSAGFDGELYAEAVHSVLKVDVDRTWSSYEHVTDSGILADLLPHTRVDGDRVELAAQVKRRFIELVRDYLAHQPSAANEIAGARALVARLRTAPGVRVAVATGGWEDTAKLKLLRIGIELDGLALASSSDASARAEIMRIAARRALNGAAFDRATYFGDGPWDQRASALLGYDFIAVGNAVSHPVAFADFRDDAAILRRLGVAAEPR